MNDLYLDHCSSTPLFPEVRNILCELLVTDYSNPNSPHPLGNKANKLVEQASLEIASLLGVKEDEVIFTSGATESNNLAIRGYIKNVQKNTKKIVHVVTTCIEHSSVYECFKNLELEGVEVTFLPVNSKGVVESSSFADAIKENTIFASIMHVNNEVGSIQPIDEISTMCKTKGICFHVDAVQSWGKVPLNFENIDLCTLSGHKIGGPKGIGVLIIKKAVKIDALFYGGNKTERPGTLNVPAIVAFAKALTLSRERNCYNLERMKTAKEQLFYALNTPDFLVNTPIGDFSAPHILNFSHASIPSSIFINQLAQKKIFVSSQSACSSKSNRASRVLMNMFKDEHRASTSIRISMNYEIEDQQVKYLIDNLLRISKK